MNLAPNTKVTIEKKSNVGKDGVDYGRFYVNGVCMDDLKNGVQPPAQAQAPTPPPVQAQPVATPVSNGSVSLETINAKLDKVIAKIEENLPF